MNSSDNLADPFARFRSSMGGSSTEHPGAAASTHHSVGRTSRATSRSPDPTDSAAVIDDDSDEDGSQLLRLIDEATHATTHVDDVLGGTHGTDRGAVATGLTSRDPGASFVVTANASMSSFAAAHSTTHNVFGSPPPVSPPSFAETITSANRMRTPATGPLMASAHQPGSPPPFGVLSNSIHQASSSTTSVHTTTTGHHSQAGGSAVVHAQQQPPPPPPPGGPLETMIVRNHRGVFLLNPVGKSSMSASHPNTPPYAPPQYSSSSAVGGSSPPVSPLPSYALPPPVPPMNSSIGHSVHGGSPVTGSTGNPTPPPAPPGGIPPPAKQLTHGQSPPSYPAPPPYRSPSAKGAASGSGGSA
ncbi:Hypothetical protein, putative [Bodo saltans]|uniref:Uncharacterized protein n=1 Tax=Bodo saltans TaxID=75058 RepID=A0A0S4JBZ7_BODSA|nr:Hypothetical protein, putative [Bodo saltans]|eukprot:CUG87722.1 Hypothetical protein, putative [Bodo saltans]